MKPTEYNLICPDCRNFFVATPVQVATAVDVNLIVCSECNEAFLKKVALGKDPLSNAKKAIDAAQTLLKSVDTSSSSAMKVEDIYLPLNHLFSVASKQAFQFEKDQIKSVRKVKVLYTTVDKVTDEVRFFGARVTGERNIFDAAKTVATTINELSKDGFITGVLKGCKLMLIELATEPHQLKQWVVVSYVSLSPQGIEALKSKKYPTLVDDPGSLPEAHIK